MHMVKPHPLSLSAGSGALSRGHSIVPPTFGNPATSLMERSMGFAPPPRGGFAFVALPERHSACENDRTNLEPSSLYARWPFISREAG
jgi:hypothetical protein